MKHINHLESGLTEITQNSNLCNRKCLNVSVPQNTQKRGSELLSSVKTGRIVAHENLHVSNMRSLRIF